MGEKGRAQPNKKDAAEKNRQGNKSQQRGRVNYNAQNVPRKGKAHGVSRLARSCSFFPEQKRMSSVIGAFWYLFFLWKRFFDSSIGDRSPNNAARSFVEWTAERVCFFSGVIRGQKGRRGRYRHRNRVNKCRYSAMHLYEQEFQERL